MEGQRATSENIRDTNAKSIQSLLWSRSRAYCGVDSEPAVEWIRWLLPSLLRSRFRASCGADLEAAAEPAEESIRRLLPSLQ